MLVQVVFLTVLFLSSSPSGVQGSFIGEIFNVICNICLTIVKDVDDTVNNEGLKKDAVYLCKAILPDGLFEDMCVSIVGGLIHEVYAILEGLEPTPTLCYDLRICTNCTSKGGNETGKSNHTFFPLPKGGDNLLEAAKGFEIHTKVFEAASKLLDLQNTFKHHHTMTTVSP
ncbi:hypothetical protein FO519_004664 [Halicephalobus sp. NKZ332]|nr:hypothetical protein FO519_004664 [Halicephalobus sp. NKZ332]